MDIYSSRAMDSTWKGWLLLTTFYLAFYQEQTTAFTITTPYSLYVCPEGQNVTLTCKLTGSLSAPHDLLYKIWYFSSNRDQSCSEKQHIRNISERDLHHELGRHHGTHSNVTEKYFHGERANYHGLETTSDHHGTFRIIIKNLTLQDSGNYCCYVVDTKKEHGKLHTTQVSHGFMELRIQKAREAFPNCTFHLGASKEKESAHELVRMESNAQGIENPVFEAVPSTNTESRPKLQMTYIASRQPSESGRHLLSEPNTPLSPPGTGDCFFPTLEPVPDSPNFMNA
ncbi:V-type immunoglobulin domain-containing suppressor of T-cell activation isoform X2 [Pelodiscus sinensis]|uniref:V-type immunoglobulin domain-containing suppressor of T-cell activation isoform X2 n=1 Tax=Pelodiscus sinensis TaxID=13735 RepID=UPI003F6AC609